MFSYLTLPTSAPTDLFASIATLFSDLWQLIAIAVGIPLAFFLIDLLISIIRPVHSSQYSEKELEDVAHGIKK